MTPKPPVTFEDDFRLDVAGKSGFLEAAEQKLANYITNYQPLLDIKQRVVKLSRLDTNLPVIILGETGTGKELIAEALHGARKGEFVPVNCSGIPTELLEVEFFGCVKGAYTGATSDRTGLVKEAKGGTLFLDEIGDMPPALQAKLLRLLEQKKFRPVGSPKEESADCRFVSATNKINLEDSPTFRSDLYYRLAGHKIILPTLAERGGEDLRLLVNYFCKSNEQLAAKILNDITGKLLKGNVRQLINIIEEHKVLSL
jgi:transcriptional regulator with PAS, ATPase and Fis domain